MFSILYVDDEPGLLEIGRMFLEQGGLFAVDTLTSATEALDVIRTKRYDAIISDYQMPVMDGIEFLKRVRAADTTIPFIIFTGRGREEVVIQAFNEGADFYLQKGGEPVSQFAELGHKTRKAILQRRAEASIRDHERREADIINFLPDATFAIDTRGVVIAWNRAMEKMTGVGAESMLGKGNYEYALPFYHERRPLLINLVLDDDPAIAEKYPFVKREERTLFSEITIPHFNDGRGAALWFTASPLYDKDGAIVGAIESIREISDWKRAEQALNESERRFRELADMLPQMVYEADARGNLTYANHIAFETFGYSGEDFRRGLNVMQMISPGDRDRAFTAIRSLLAGSGRTRRDTAEYRALRRDGTEFPVVIYSAPILAQGVVTGLRGIIVDISGPREAEDLIRTSEEKYRTVFETTGTATVLIENDGTISLANTEFERLSGYRKDEIENRRKWTEFVVEEDRGRMLAQHQLRRKDRPSALTHYEFRFRSRSGGIRDIYLTIDVIPGTDRSVASLLDMTERKDAERSLVIANQEYTNLLNQIQDVYYRSDTEGRLVKVSRSWATLLGYDTVAECLGRDIANDFYYHPADRNRFLELIHRDGKVTNYEVLLKKKDGTPVIVSTSSHRYTDTAGNYLGVEGTFRDITALKHRETILRIQLDLGMKLQELRAREEVLETCLDAAIRISDLDAGGIYLVDETTGAVDLVVSKNISREFFAAVSHYEPDSVNAGIVMAGKPVYEQFSRTGVPHTSVHEQEGLRALAMIPVLSRGRVVGSLNIASYTRDEIPEESRIALETIATQIGAAIERARANEALMASEQRYRNVVEDMTEFICRFLPDGTHIFVNEAYCRFFGLAHEEIIGHRFRPDIPPEDQRRMDQFFRSLTPDHPIDIIVHRIIMPDGRIRWQRWSDRAIFDSSGNLVEYQSVGRDITEMKETELALQASEEQHRILAGLLDLMPASVTVHDMEGRFLYANQKTFEYHGYTKEEFYRINLHELDVPQSEKLIEEHIRELRERGSASFEAQHYRKDRSVIPLLINAMLTTWGGGPVILSVATDITEHKEIQNALQQSEERFRTLLTSLNEGIWVVDAGGITTFVNQKMADMLGYTVDEMNGAPMYRFMDEKGREIAARNYPAYRNGIREQVEFEFVRKDGSKITALVSNTSLFDPSGAFVGAMAAITDITERRQADEALKTAQEKYSKAFHSVPDAMTISELESGTFIEVNGAATSLFGYTRDELIGNSAIALGIWQTAQDREVFVRQLVKKGRVTGFEAVERRKSGELYTAMINAEMLTFGGQKYLLAVIRDVTEQKRAEQVIREANRKINLLTSITRHDVANQVTVLRGYTKLALMKKPDPAVTDILQKINAAVSAISLQVAFTKEYQELGVQAPGWHRIRDIIALQKPGGISLSCTCDAEVFADPMLERVFFNLVDNAVRHGGNVSQITVRCRTEGENLVIVVSDNGVGVPARHKEKIFEKGFGKHTGYGLFLVREILAITGITIRETGTRGEGAVFEITVPKGAYRLIA